MKTSNGLRFAWTIPFSWRLVRRSISFKPMFIVSNSVKKVDFQLESFSISTSHHFSMKSPKVIDSNSFEIL